MCTVQWMQKHNLEGKFVRLWFKVIFIGYVFIWKKFQTFKSNLVQDFANVDFQAVKSNSAKCNFKKEKLWLKFLVSLSFTMDGQQFFMKVESLLNTVIKFYDLFNSLPSSVGPQNSESQYFSLLILRNLAFNPSNKSKLVSHCNIQIFEFFSPFSKIKWFLLKLKLIIWVLFYKP